VRKCVNARKAGKKEYEKRESKLHKKESEGERKTSVWRDIDR
jgi:hypothetical protein